MSRAERPPETDDPGSDAGAASYDVRVWRIQQYKGKRGTTHAVRWAVAGQRFRRTFATAKLADRFRADLLTASRSGKGFDIVTGLPELLRHERPTASWFDHAVAFAHAKWPQSSPAHRRGIAETLTDVTVELTKYSGPLPTFANERTGGSHRGEPAASSSAQLRRTLYRLAFAANSPEPTPDERRILSWAGTHSVAITALAQPSVVRQVHDRLARRIDGSPAAPSTLARKRAVFHSALQYAVEAGHLTTNPLERLRLRRPVMAGHVDRRVVANPDQAGALLAAIRQVRPELEAFFACLYYAGLRPAEARGLTQDNLTLPITGWGEILLTGSHQTSGAAWTDDRQGEQRRQLKHRARNDTRLVPAHPELVRILREHLDNFPTGTSGQLFVARTGRAGVPLPPPFAHPIGLNTLYRTWERARQIALTPVQVQSPLAKRPYDLRHACLSTWLNAGVPAAQVAEWAGHSINVLLRVYAKCIDGQTGLAMKRIELALPVSPPAADPCGDG